MRRGDIWWAELDDPIGSGPGYKRPIIIVQANSFNRSRINTVVVAIITSNLKLASSTGNVRLPSTKTGLNKESVINVSQLITIDKDALTEKIFSIDHVTMQKVDDGIRLVLGL